MFDRETSPRVLCIGALVADIFISGVPHEADWREKQAIRSIEMRAGGDAVNQAIRLSDFGVRSFLAAALGADQTGQMLKSMLTSRGVDISLVAERQGMASGTAAVLVSPEGERHIFVLNAAQGTYAKADLPHLPEGIDAVTIGSLMNVPEYEREGLLDLLKEAKERGVLVFADIAAEKGGIRIGDISCFLPYFDWFLPSEEDALQLTGTDTPEAAAEAFHAAGVENVIVKCGAKGAIALTGGELIRVPAYPVRPVDTTGAGDTMVALFIYRTLAGDAPGDALRFACAGAGLSTLHVGASAVPLSEEEILKTVAGK